MWNLGTNKRKNEHLWFLSFLYSSYPNDHQVLLTLLPKYNPSIDLFKPIIISCLGNSNVTSQLVTLLHVCLSGSLYVSCVRMINLELISTHLLSLLVTLKGSLVSLMSSPSSIVCTTKPSKRCSSWTFMGHISDSDFMLLQLFFHSKLSFTSCFVLTH